MIAQVFGCTLQSLSDGGYRAVQTLMLPQAHNLPTSLYQCSISSAIAFDVPAKLRRPVRFVDRGESAVLRADMPEATVHEDRDLTSRENDIGPDFHCPKVEPEVFAVPKTQPVQRFSQYDFGFGIGSADRSHVPGAPLAGGGRIQARPVRSLPGGFRSVLSQVCPSSTHTVAMRKDTLPAHPPVVRVQSKGTSVTDLRVIEICAGAGGQALGLELAGFEHELAIELDTNAANTLKLNRQWSVKVGDVADTGAGGVWNPKEYARGERDHPIDLLAGGVPCPPFSIAGKQLGANDERDLFAWAVEQVKVIQPRALMLENVRGLSMPRFAGYRQHVLDQLNDIGYSAEWRLMEAHEYGVPQLRPRFVLVAMKHEDFSYFHWPIPTGNKLTVGQTLVDLMKVRGWDGAAAWAERAGGIAPTVVGGSKKHGGADLGPTRAKKAWAAMGVDAFGIHDHAPPYGPKRPMTEYGPKLTVEMVARLQGWIWAKNELHKKHLEGGKLSNRELEQLRHEVDLADTPLSSEQRRRIWMFSGAKTSQYRQIGNAFPPPMAEAVGRSIAAALRRETASHDRVLESTLDPIFKYLREQKGFAAVDEISDKTGLGLDATEIVRRIELLRQDFEIHEEEHETGVPTYMLGEFRAFRGEEGHVRHENFRTYLSRIS